MKIHSCHSIVCVGQIIVCYLTHIKFAGNNISDKTRAPLAHEFNLTMTPVNGCYYISCRTVKKMDDGDLFRNWWDYY